MRKKWFVLLLSVIMVIACALGLSACELFGGGQSNNQGSNENNNQQGSNQGGNEGDNQQGNNQENKLSVIGKTFYFSYVTVESDDEQTVETLTAQIKSDMRGAIVEFFENGTADIGSGELATWTQDGDTVILTSMGVSSSYKVTENTFVQSSNTTGVSITVAFTTEKPARHEVILYNENPEVGTVSGEGIYDHGEKATIVATVNKSGYCFSGWYNGDNLVAEVYDLKAGYTFEVDSDVTYTAKWVYCDVNIVNFSNENGTITWNYSPNNGDNTVNVRFNSTTNPGYIILGYYYYRSNSNNLNFISCVNPNNYTGLNGHSMTLSHPVTLEIVCITEDEASRYEFTYSGKGIGLKGVKDKTETQIFVADYIKILDDGAFEGCTGLESVTLPQNLNTISGSAFKGCSNLKKIIFNGTYKQWQDITKGENWDKDLNDCIIEIASNDNQSDSDESFFFSPIIKKDAVVAYTVTGVTDKFADERLVIPSSFKDKPVTNIKGNAFGYLNFIKSIVIPESIEKIGFAAFMGCKNLETVYWNAIRCTADKNNTATLFDGCESLTQVIFGDRVEVIRGSAFYSCGITDIQFSNSIKIIETGAFMSCNALTSVDIPDNIIEIGEAAFSFCKQLKSVRIGKGVTSINRAFYCCDSLETVYFNAVTCGDLPDWGSDMFTNSGIINGITITIGNSVKRVPDNFCNIGATSFGQNNAKINGIIFEKDSCCEYIGDYAFYLCADIKEILIPDSVTVIGINAFLECRSLETVYIGDGTAEIGEGAFDRCKKLKSFRVPDSIKKFGQSAISSDAQLEYNEFDNAYYLGNENNPFVILLSAKNQEIENCLINGNTKVIATNAFAWCTGLKNIDIPEGVVSVCEAFSYCYNIDSLHLPSSIEYFAPSWQCYIHNYTVDSDNKTYYCIDNCIIEKLTKTLVCGSDISIIPQDGSIERIGYGAFMGNSLNVEELIIPEGVTYIGARAFDNNRVLTKVVLPESLTYIGNSAFWGCKNLKQINIPQSVTYIGQGAFANCESLETISIPNGINAIYDSTFNGCKSIVEFIVPENVTAINSNAFWDCTKLESIVIPDSVKSIGVAVFRNCESLKAVYYCGSVENWTNIEINEYENESLFNATLYCYSETEPTEDGNFWHYIDGVVTVW